MQLICFYASGGGLKDPKPTHPLIKKSVYTPSLWGHSPPAAANTPLKKRALHFKQKKHPTPSSPSLKTPLFAACNCFCGLVTQFRASSTATTAERQGRRPRGRLRFKWIAVSVLGVCFFFFFCYCILYIVYFSFLHKQDEEEAPNRYQKIEQINNRRCENKIQYLQRFFAGLLQLKFQAGISQLLARGHQASELWIKYAEFYVIRKGKEESSSKGKVKAGEKVKRIWRIRRKVAAKSQI